MLLFYLNVLFLILLSDCFCVDSYCKKPKKSQFKNEFYQNKSWTVWIM